MPAAGSVADQFVQLAQLPLPPRLPARECAGGALWAAQGVGETPLHPSVPGGYQGGPGVLLLPTYLPAEDELEAVEASCQSFQAHAGSEPSAAVPDEDAGAETGVRTSSSSSRIYRCSVLRSSYSWSIGRTKTRFNMQPH
ncbi:hypothetical protein FQN55_000875 [Onygenales sp. PD_40]|nr:hypothetical protein FQN55_000875 [Onygenales sp. PD_40]KAK2784498.1 hypothetical protein FQN53_008489 [Emmonsiellopsis sp. PD_33]KAK2785326.1 hypothetical protein FQN52_008522 [Onygenales sp. PD_12]